MTIAEKRCFKCSTIKRADQFYKSTQRPDGLSSYCRQCQIADVKSRYSAHPRWRAPEGQKWCPRCESIKPLDAFGANRAQHDGKQGACKACSVAAVTASRHKDPTSHRESSRRWREQNLDRHADNNAKRSYGVEHGTYATMLKAQDGKCAICGTTEPGVRLKRFHFDHCHNEGHVRGLLCQKCNQGIGLFNHNVEIILSAAEYLEKTKTPPSVPGGVS